jgi:hypothetical protein
LLGKLPTRENLCKKGIIHINDIRCPLCDGGWKRPNIFFSIVRLLRLFGMRLIGG